jgi:hypothetical protein
VATGWSRYLDISGAIEREYHNCLVMRFDERDQCSAFTEWFMQGPAGLR